MRQSVGARHAVQPARLHHLRRIVLGVDAHFVDQAVQAVADLQRTRSKRPIMKCKDQATQRRWNAVLRDIVLGRRQVPVDIRNGQRKHLVADQAAVNVQGRGPCVIQKIHCEQSVMPFTVHARAHVRQRDSTPAMLAAHHIGTALVLDPVAHIEGGLHRTVGADGQAVVVKRLIVVRGARLAKNQRAGGRCIEPRLDGPFAPERVVARAQAVEHAIAAHRERPSAGRVRTEVQRAPHLFGDLCLVQRRLPDAHVVDVALESLAHDQVAHLDAGRRLHARHVAHGARVVAQRAELAIVAALGIGAEPRAEHDPLVGHHAHVAGGAILDALGVLETAVREAVDVDAQLEGHVTVRFRSAANQYDVVGRRHRVQAHRSLQRPVGQVETLTGFVRARHHLRHSNNSRTVVVHEPHDVWARAVQRIGSLLDFLPVGEAIVIRVDNVRVGARCHFVGIRYAIIVSIFVAIDRKIAIRIRNSRVISQEVFVKVTESITIRVLICIPDVDDLRPIGVDHRGR